MRVEVGISRKPQIVSVILTGFLVPRVAVRFGWWLQPASTRDAMRTNIQGAALIVVIYAVVVTVFWRFF